MFESSFGDGYHEGEAVGLEKGIEIGIEQTTSNIAISLAKEGTPIELIAKVTDLSEAEIKVILQKMNML